MPFFEITFFVEPQTAAGEDIEIGKIVEARDEGEALDLAKRKLRDENPEINPAKATAWFIETSSAGPNN
jgi:hypothetical protein